MPPGEWTFFCQAVGVALQSLYRRTAGQEFDKACKKFLGPCFAVSPEKALINGVIAIPSRTVGSLDTSAQAGLFLGCSSCHLSAEVFPLVNFFVVEGRCEVFGLEDLADLYLGFAFCVGVGTALDPLDGLFERLELPEPEAGDEFLTFGEGAVRLFDFENRSPKSIALEWDGSEKPANKHRCRSPFRIRKSGWNAGAREAPRQAQHGRKQS